MCRSEELLPSRKGAKSKFDFAVRHYNLLAVIGESAEIRNKPC